MFDGDVGNAHYPVRVRASGTTFEADADPLIVVDGVIISASGGQAMEALIQIPASDVESIKVLRGPAAAVRYPMAANGVVVVTTRRSGRR